MVRIVLDTNVLVSAMLSPHGPPARILEMVSQRAVRLAVSPDILGEYENVITRKEFDFSPATSEDMPARIRGLGIDIVPSETIRACKDPDDDKFLECAAAAGVHYLITGNQKDFPRRFGSVRIVSPAAFLREV